MESFMRHLTNTAAVLLALIACSDHEPTALPSRSASPIPSFAVTENIAVREDGATMSVARLDGCPVTEISLLAVERVTRQDGSATSHVEAFLTASVQDVCSGGIVDRLASLQSSVSFTADLNTANLNGTLLVQDLVGNLRTAPVSLTWTGVGEITKDKAEVTVQNGGGMLVVLRTKGAARSATLAGTVDFVDVAGIEHFATLFEAVEGTLTITRS